MSGDAYQEALLALVEATGTAWRPRTAAGGIRFHPAWHDLDDNSRVLAYEATRTLRLIEANLDADGLSSTARAVLARIRR